MTNAGYIIIDSKILANMFDLEGGIIWSAEVDGFNRLKVLVEHPDFPEVFDNHPISAIPIAYSASYGENGVITKIERTTPSKRIKNVNT